MKYLMKCGHVANATDKDGNPVCVICAPGENGVTVERIIEHEMSSMFVVLSHNEKQMDVTVL